MRIYETQNGCVHVTCSASAWRPTSPRDRGGRSIGEGDRKLWATPYTVVQTSEKASLWSPERASEKVSQQSRPQLDHRLAYVSVL
jgi:hypothetical protein